MKKIAILLFVALGMLTACDPVCDDKDPGGSITADQLKSMCTVTVDQLNGKNINYVHVSTTAPANVVWSNGAVKSTYPTTAMTMLVTGEQTITCTAMNGDGSTVVAEFPVKIDEIDAVNHPVSKYWEYLCGTGSKVWEWDNSINGRCWGNCGYTGVNAGGLLTGNDWWGVTSADITGQMTSYGYGLNDSGDATMTLSLSGASIVKSSGGKGTFEFDDTNTASLGGYSDITTAGRLTTTGDGILFPIKINGKGATASTFDISYIDKDHLILACPNHPASEAGAASWMEATFWRFKAK